MTASRHAQTRRPGFFRVLWRAARQVFHETTGTVFLLLAVSWALAALRQWRHGSAPWLWVICGSFALMLVVFGLTSFRSARRLR